MSSKKSLGISIGIIVLAGIAFLTIFFGIKGKDTSTFPTYLFPQGARSVTTEEQGQVAYATYESDLSLEELVDHYRRELKRNKWEIQFDTELEQSIHRIYASKEPRSINLILEEKIILEEGLQKRAVTFHLIPYQPVSGDGITETRRQELLEQFQAEVFTNTQDANSEE